MAARTAFYKARTRLGNNTSIWINEDLTHANEILAYQGRQLCYHHYLHRTWTYLGQVFIIKKEGDEPMFELLDKITTPRGTPGKFQANRAQKSPDANANSARECEPTPGTSKTAEETNTTIPETAATPTNNKLPAPQDEGKANKPGTEPIDLSSPKKSM